MLIADIIAWIILGAVAGWIASIITDTREGLVSNIVVGIIGAFVGGILLRLFGVNATTGGLSLNSLLTAIIGAAILLLVMRGFRRAQV